MIAAHNNQQQAATSRASSRIGQCEDMNGMTTVNGVGTEPGVAVGEQGTMQEAPHREDSMKAQRLGLNNGKSAGTDVQNNPVEENAKHVASPGHDDDDDVEEDEEEEEEEDDDDDDEELRTGGMRDEESGIVGGGVGHGTAELAGRENARTGGGIMGMGIGMGMGMVTGTGVSELGSGGGGGGGMGGYWRQSRPSSPRMPPPEQPEQRPKSRHDQLTNATTRYNNLGYWRARRVIFYKNGDPYFPGVEFR